MNDRRVDRLKGVAAGAVLISGAAFAQPPRRSLTSAGPMTQEEPAPVQLNAPNPPDPALDAGVPSPKPPVHVNSPPKTKP